MTIREVLKTRLPALFSNQTKGSIHKRALWLAWSGIINIVNSVVLWMVMARWREAAEVGRFTIAMSIYLVFFGLCSLGLAPMIINEYTRRREIKNRTSDNETFIASTIVFMFGCSILFALMMCVAGFLIAPSSESRWTTAILSLAIPPTSLLIIAESVFTARGQTRLVAFATTLENIFRTFVPLILVVMGFSLALIALALVMARLVACCFYALAARRKLAVLAKANLNEIRRIAKNTPTFAGITILSSLHWQLPTIMLGWIGSEIAAAEYGVASRFLVPSVVLLASYSNVLLPEVARLSAISTEAMGKFLSRGLQFVLYLALPFAVGTTLLSREALVWLFGTRYGVASTALSLLAFSALPLGLVMIISRGLIANGYQRIDLLGNAFAVLTSAISGWLLMPRYGATGAALAHLISMIVLVGVEIIYASRCLFKLEMGRAIVLCLVPLIAMSLAVWPMRGLGVVIAASVGALVYLIGLWLMMGSPHRLMVGGDAANPG